MKATTHPEQPTRPILWTVADGNPFPIFTVPDDCAHAKENRAQIRHNIAGELMEKLRAARTDAVAFLDSGSSSRKGVEVQVLSSAPASQWVPSACSPERGFG